METEKESNFELVSRTYSVHELRQLSDEFLIKKHDRLVNGRRIDNGEYFLGELYRRQQERHTAGILRLTRCIAVMTAVVLVATLVNVVLAVV